MWSVTDPLADTHGSSYLFGNDGTPEVVDSSYDPVAFIYKNLLDLQICNVSICKRGSFILQRLTLREFYVIL